MEVDHALPEAFFASTYLVYCMFGDNVSSHHVAVPPTSADGPKLPDNRIDTSAPLDIYKSVSFVALSVNCHCMDVVPNSETFKLVGVPGIPGKGVALF